MSDDSVVAAFDTCLQCRACEAVCPAKVRYGDIIEGARAMTARSSGLASRVSTMALKNPRFLNLALAAGGAVARWWPALARRLGRPARLLLRARWPLTANPAASSASVMFGGCVSRSFEREAQQALLRLAAASNAALSLLPEQGCCGGLSRHRGDPSAADELGRYNRQLWARSGTRVVVTLDSGCVDGLRRSAGDIKVIEACRWLLDQTGATALRLHPKARRIGWYAPCSHRNIAGDAAAATELLARLPGALILNIGAGFGCCGAAGPHLLAHPETADALALPIINAIEALNLDALASTNVGCNLHLSERLAARGIKLPVRHPLAFLADQLDRNST